MTFLRLSTRLYGICLGTNISMVHTGGSFCMYEATFAFYRLDFMYSKWYLVFTLKGTQADTKRSLNVR